MTTFAILGSGFGLYGYLPALVREDVQHILLPERYRHRLLERLELYPFMSNIQWEENEDAILNRADGVVLAMRPSDQSMWIPRCLERSNLKRMILEKPLAHSPEVATTVFEELMDSHKIFRIGYIFRTTMWGKQLLDFLMPKQQDIDLLSIRWNFLAHHYRYNLDNWKRFNNAGGGALRFYGIQIIALLAEAGYRNVISSQASGPSSEEFEKWSAVFEGRDLPVCEVVLNTRATVSEFQITKVFKTKLGSKAIPITNQTDPFEGEKDIHIVSKIDRRVSLLGRLYSSLYDESVSYYECYDATIRLWRLIEEKIQFDKRTDDV